MPIIGYRNTVKHRKKSTHKKTLKKKHHGMDLKSKFVSILNSLKEYMTKNGDYFRAKAYGKAADVITKFPGEIQSVSQLRGIKHIGSSTLAKLEEFVTTNKIEQLSNFKENPIYTFTNIFGIGPKKARVLVDEYKITTIEELREKQDEVLNDVQKKGLRYYEDFIHRIPREEIDAYQKILQRYFDTIKTSTALFQIVGSYRRGAITSGDIDVIITDTTNEIFHSFIKLLVKKKIVVEILSKGESKSLAVSKLPNQPARRIDFLYSPPEEYHFALLYFTGNATSNVLMREKALEMGYTLNEHGLYKMENGVKGDHVPIEGGEKDIFDFLDIPYRAPQDRTGKEMTAKKMVVKAKKRQPNVRKLIENLQDYGIDALKGLSEDQLSNMIRHASKAYYNKTPLITDETFDILKEFILEKHPNNEAAHEIGAPVKKNKVRLPYFMGSMDKIKPDTNLVPQWKENYEGPYVVSGKLNGVSGLYTTMNNEVKLYTRGDGKMGQDVSHMIPYLDLPKVESMVVRGEFIMTKGAFEEHHSTNAANPLGAIVSTVNAKQLNKKKLDNLQFVAYEVIQPVLKPSEQMKFLEENGFSTVIYKKEEDIGNELLSNYLVKWREHYQFEIDGVIIVNDEIYPREDGNPSHAFAFKMVLGEQVVEAKVVDVVWEPSMYGYLKPRIRIEPVKIGGARIEYVTAFNAGYVRDNNIGVGTVVKMVRSGDVIPHILEVITPASKPKMPFEPYRWTSTKVDIILLDKKDHPEVSRKKITYFFKTLDVDGVGAGNVKRFVDGGYNTIAKVLEMSKEDMMKLDGFKERKVDKIYDSIVEKVKMVNLPQLMAASGVFGRGMGASRIEKILEEYPDILVLDQSYDERVDDIYEIKGFAVKTAKLFARYVPAFLKFMKETNLEKDLVWEKKVKSNHMLAGKSIVITGFRDGEFEEKIEAATGIKLSKSVNKKTFALIVKGGEVATGKMAKAVKLKIPTYTRSEFEKVYLEGEVVNDDIS